VIQSAEIDKERIRILDGLGINMKDMPELRMALLGTETHKTSGKTVYCRRIYWCACHVNSNDMIAGSHPGSLKCKPGFKFLSMKESRERLALLTFVSPQLKHASPLALALSSEADALTEELVLQKGAMKKIKFEVASNDQALQLELVDANETIERLTVEISSNQLLLVAQEKRMRQLSQPRKNINAVHANIRREHAKMETEAQELMVALPHNMATIEEVCRRSGVIFASPSIVLSVIICNCLDIYRSADADFLTPFFINRFRSSKNWRIMFICFAVTLM